MNKTIKAVMENESFWKFSKEIATNNPILAVVFIIIVLLILVYALKIILKYLSKKDCDVKTYNFELLLSQQENIKEKFKDIQENLQEISKHVLDIDRIPEAFEKNTLKLINKIQEWQRG